MLTVPNTNVSDTILATFTLKAIPNPKKPHNLLALYDPGSQISIISRKYADKLKCKKLRDIKVPMTGINSSKILNT